MSRPFTINGMRRGTVVRPAGPPGEWSGFYGRVVKVLSLGLVVVIDCGKHITIYHINEIEADGYKGRYENDYFDMHSREHWLAMPNIRWLKKRCEIYNPKRIPYLSKMVEAQLEANPNLLAGVNYQDPRWRELEILDEDK